MPAAGIGFKGNQRWRRGVINPTTGDPHKGCAMEFLADAIPADGTTDNDYAKLQFDGFGHLFQLDIVKDGDHTRWRRGVKNPDTGNPHGGCTVILVAKMHAPDAPGVHRDGGTVTTTFQFDGFGRLFQMDSEGDAFVDVTYGYGAFHYQWRRGQIDGFGDPFKGFGVGNGSMGVFTAYAITDTHNNSFLLEFDSFGCLRQLQTARVILFTVEWYVDYTPNTNGGILDHYWVHLNLPLPRPGGAFPFTGGNLGGGPWRTVLDPLSSGPPHDVTLTYSNGGHFGYFGCWDSNDPDEASQPLPTTTPTITVKNVGTNDIVVDGVLLHTGDTKVYGALYDNGAVFNQGDVFWRGATFPGNFGGNGQAPNGFSDFNVVNSDQP